MAVATLPRPSSQLQCVEKCAPDQHSQRSYKRLIDRALTHHLHLNRSHWLRAFDLNWAQPLPSDVAERFQKNLQKLDSEKVEQLLNTLDVATEIVWKRLNNINAPVEGTKQAGSTPGKRRSRLDSLAYSLFDSGSGNNDRGSGGKG